MISFSLSNTIQSGPLFELSPWPPRLTPIHLMPKSTALSLMKPPSQVSISTQLGNTPLPHEKLKDWLILRSESGLYAILGGGGRGGKEWGVPTQIHLMLLLRRYSVCVAQSTASLNHKISCKLIDS